METILRRRALSTSALGWTYERRLPLGLLAYSSLLLSLVNGLEVAIYFFLTPLLAVTSVCRKPWHWFLLIAGASLVTCLILFSWVWEYDPAYMPLVGIALLVFFTVLLGSHWVIQDRTSWIMPELLTPVVWLSMMVFFSPTSAGSFWLDIALFQPLSMPLISYVGSVGVTFLIILNNAVWAQLLVAPSRGRQLAAPLVLSTLLGCWVYSVTIPPALNTHRVALVQGNFSLDWQWRQLSANGLIINTYEQLSRRVMGQNVDLVVWPEYALPVDVVQHNPSLMRRLKALSVELQVPVMLGATVLDGESDDHFDSALMFEHGELAGRYDSQYPAFFNQFTTPGRGALSLLQPAESQLKIGTIICFEETNSGLFLDYVSLGASVFVSLANNQDLGLGRQLAARYGQLRAAEMGRFLVRASNDGVTQVVDAWGRVARSLPLDEAGVLIAEIALMRDRTWYSRFGYLGVCLLIFATLLISYGWKRGCGSAC